MSETNGHLNGNGTPKKKYNYTKKTGAPAKAIEDLLPPNWKEQILDLSAQGYSDVSIRARLSMPNGKFSHDMWYALKKRNDEFLETIQIGKVLCQAWWEEQSMHNLMHSKADVFETGSWYANMKNRFGWRDKTEQEVNINFTAKTIMDMVQAADKQTNRVSEHV